MVTKFLSRRFKSTNYLHYFAPQEIVLGNLNPVSHTTYRPSSLIDLISVKWNSHRLFFGWPKSMRHIPHAREIEAPGGEKTNTRSSPKHCWGSLKTEKRNARVRSVTILWKKNARPGGSISHQRRATHRLTRAGRWSRINAILCSYFSKLFNELNLISFNFVTFPRLYKRSWVQLVEIRMLIASFNGLLFLFAATNYNYRNFWNFSFVVCKITLYK